MDALLLVARLILAAVLLLSGALKLVDRDGSRETFEGVGVPDMVARPLVWLLPSVELVVGLLICVPATARLASAAAVVLLAGYIVVVWRLVRRGSAVACHCFGALSSEPVSYRTLVRNLVLLALALLGAVGQVGGYWTSWQWVREAPPATDVALVVSTAALGTTVWLAVLALKLMRRNGELLQAAGDSGILTSAARRPSGPAVNTVALEFDLSDADGESWTLDRLVKPGRHLALVSVDPNCGPCRALLPELATWLGRNDGSPLDVVLLSGDAAATARECSSNGVHVPVLAADRQTLAAYGLSGTPAVVVVGPDRRFKAGPAGGRTAVLELLDRLVAMRGVPHGRAGLPDKLPALPVTDAGGPSGAAAGAAAPADPGRVLEEYMRILPAHGGRRRSLVGTATGRVRHRRDRGGRRRRHSAAVLPPGPSAPRPQDLRRPGARRHGHPERGRRGRRRAPGLGGGLGPRQRRRPDPA